MTSMKPFLLASSALLAATTMTPVQAAPPTSAFIVAQAQGGGAAPEKKKEEEKKGPPPAAHPAPPKPPAGHPAPPRPPAAPPAPPKPPAAVEHKPPPPPAAPHPAPPRPAQTAPVHPPAPPHPAQAQPVRPPAPPHPAQIAPVHKPAPPASAQKPPAPPPPKQAAPVAPPPPKQAAPVAPPHQQPAAQQKPPGAPPTRQAGPEGRRREEHRTPTTQPAPQQAAPAAAPKQAAPNAAPGQPAASKSAAPAAMPQQPVKPRNADEFIRKGNNQPQRTMKDVRQERRTTRQDGRVFIQEGDRTIVREQNRTFIRHNEDQRFAIGARDVHVDHRDGDTITTIARPDGVRIINTTDRDGHLIRRVARDRNGREFVIIDNRHRRQAGIFINVPPPRIHIPRRRYIVDADRADESEIYDVLIAPPVEAIDEDYSLAQVRYNEALRAYMPRLDLDINFDTGSWQITPAQMDRLALVAAALNRAIARNPREVFLIEGHTDAVGSEEDNLSLSDRRAEAVAVALTEEFHVPPENLVTQGYGEQELKVPTQGPSRANRRVAIRRITPLIDRNAGR